MKNTFKVTAVVIGSLLAIMLFVVIFRFASMLSFNVKYKEHVRIIVKEMVREQALK